MRIMLTLYRRHLPTCKHVEKGRAHTKCSCPIWIDGMQDGRRVNYSLKTTNWTKSCRTLRDIESGVADPDRALKPVAAAAADFVAKLETERMSGATIQKYRAALLGTPGPARDRQAARYTTPLATAAAAAGVKFVQNIDLEFLESYRRTWTGGPTTATKRIDRLRSFLGWCVTHGWLRKNPAAGLRPPQERVQPTMPYSRAEFQALLIACDHPKRFESAVIRDNRQRLKALLMLLRFSGLRISDAIMLTPDKVAGGRVKLYTQKTGVAVCVPLPPMVMEELERTPFTYGRFWWWGGRAGVDSTAETWRKRLKLAGAIAGVDGAEWHRFRDTFAVELLLAGVGLEKVSVLLGHRSIRITERHYSPWVSTRQAQAEAEVAAAWAKDPVVQVFELRRESDRETVEVRN